MTSGRASRLARRLDAIERERPDGSVASWRWLWRTLERSSDSPWRLRARFVFHVTGDVVLLAGWWIGRSPARFVRRSPGRTLVLLIGLTLLGGIWWIAERPYSPRVPVARVEIERERVRFEGQWMSLPDFPDDRSHPDPAREPRALRS